MKIKQLILILLFALAAFFLNSISKIQENSTIEVQISNKIYLIEASSLNPIFYLLLAFCSVYAFFMLKKIQVSTGLGFLHFLFTTFPIFLILPKLGYSLIGMAGFSRRYYSYTNSGEDVAPVNSIQYFDLEIFILCFLFLIGQLVFILNIRNTIKKQSMF